jgi:uncharacterized protein with beta-barrel porin domain
MNAANAGDVSIESTGSISSGNITTLVNAANGTLDIDGGVVATLSLDVGNHADGGAGIVLGDSGSGTETSVLKVVATSAALSVAPTVKTLNAQVVGNLQVQDSTAGASGDLVTFTGIIGGGAANIIDTIQVGDADEVAGNAKFEADVKATAIAVEGGDASEDSVAEFNSTVAGAITLDDVASKGSAKVIFSGSTGTRAASVVGESDGDGTVQVTGTALTLSGRIGQTGIGTMDVDATATMTNLLDAQVVDIATGTTFTIDDDFTGDATTVNGTGKIVFDVDGDGAATTAVTAVIDADADGSGTLQFTNTSLTTVTGNVGVTKQIGTIDADKSVTFVGILDAAAVDVAAGATLTVDDDYTGTTTTLTTTGTLAFVVDADGAAVTTVTGTIDGAAAEGGDIQTNNSGGTTFAGAIGSTFNIGDVNVDEAATFSSTVSAETMDVAASKVATFNDALTVTDDSVLNGQAVFAGTTSYTVNAFLQEGAGAGNISVTNTSTHGITFTQPIGTQDDGTADSIDIFATATATKVVLKSDDNLADEINLVGTSAIVLDDTILKDQTVFMDSTATVAADVPTTSKIFMPSNLKDGEIIYFLSDVSTTTDLDTNVTTAAQDNALYTYAATIVDAVDTTGSADDIAITATARPTSTIATQISTTSNDALGFLEATRAASDNSDTTLIDIFSNALNSLNGLTTADATALAKQVAPQTDLISGSTFGAQAVTGSMQGIMSNRMASLRSGDAYFGTGVAAGGMSAQSGFIQVFGSETDQDSTKIGSGTQAGYDASTQGVAIGFDGASDAGMTIGVSLATANTDIDGKGTGKSSNSIDTYSASLYMDTVTDNGYFEGSLSFGVNENSSSRKINSAGLDRTLTGSYDSNSISLSLGAGMPNEVGVGYLTPFGSLTTTVMDIDAYTEKSTVADDSLRLKVAQDDVNSMVGTVGLKFHGEMSNGGVPMISLAINNEFGDNTIDSTNTFQGGGTAFKTSTAVEELSATLGLGYSYGTDSTSIEFAYEADANDDDYLSHYGSIKIVGKF